MIIAIIAVTVCYIIPTILMLLFFKYAELGKTASDTAILRDSFIPVVNISCVFVVIGCVVHDLLKRLPKPTLFDRFKRMVLKFVRGN